MFEQFKFDELIALISSHLVPAGVDKKEYYHSGKVRDSFRLVQEGKKYRLVIASDRISIFDFVLGFLIPLKGYVLTALNIFWRLFIRQHLPGVRDDLVAFGPAIDAYLPWQLHGNSELWKRGIIVLDLTMIDREIVTRANLVGTGWEVYEERGIVCGQRLKKGLRKGEPLPRHVVTPTTKAKEGHDIHTSIQSLRRSYSGLEQLALELFEVRSLYCASVGLHLVDDKIEVGVLPESQGYIIADEIGTPDSGRHWLLRAYRAWLTNFAHGFSVLLPESFDKQLMREWGIKLGVQKRDPKKSTDREWVKVLVPPEKVISETTRRYLIVLEMVTTMNLEQFWEKVMLLPREAIGS